jgi:hypothetical protein
MSSVDGSVTVRKAVKNMSQRPLILFTNDDGIASPGLWAIAGAFAEVGDEEGEAALRVGGPEGERRSSPKVAASRR